MARRPTRADWDDAGAAFDTIVEALERADYQVVSDRGWFRSVHWESEGTRWCLALYQPTTLTLDMAVGDGWLSYTFDPNKPTATPEWFVGRLIPAMASVHKRTW